MGTGPGLFASGGGVESLGGSVRTTIRVLSDNYLFAPVSWEADKPFSDRGLPRHTVAPVISALIAAIVAA